MTKNNVNEILQSLTEMKQDQSINKSAKDRIDKIMQHLQQDPELGKDKAIVEIEEMVSANDIEPYLRAQIWNVMSMIESL